DIAEFVGPYTLKVGKETIKSDLIFLCTGSKSTIPPIKYLEGVGYHTSKTILQIEQLPESLIIVGGGYIAAEYGHFFAAMGSKVTIIGRNPQFLPQEEPEISNLAKKELSKHMQIYTNHEVKEVRKTPEGMRQVVSINRETSEELIEEATEILIAAGRTHLNDILHPEVSGVEVNEKGWIKVNEFLETTQPGIWAFGDATGEYLFKHAANYESRVVYYNALLDRRKAVDYHAIPHAVFTYPEIAGVGMGEKEAVEEYGKDKVAIGFQLYENTAKGEAMAIYDYFVKVIINYETNQILGAHIIGPQASVLIQEIINLMYTHDRSTHPIQEGMHIHPALSEVVERAFYNLMNVDHYHEYLQHLKLE
ncbi:MAG: FAD-dependent oxidoreductase, partial [Candidatus Heimdallarchaeaceae archaeon]